MAGSDAARVGGRVARHYLIRHGWSARVYCGRVRRCDGTPGVLGGHSQGRKGAGETLEESLLTMCAVAAKSEHL